MVINGHSRSNGAFFSKHLMKAEDNERVEVKEIRGLMAQDVKEAFLEMRMIAAGTGAKNYFYHANLNPREGEHLTPEQWTIAVDTLEKNLGLEGHARFVVEHEKNGRTHQHVIFSRVNPDTMTTVSDSFNYLAHTDTARELEQLFDHEPTRVPPAPERDRFKDWETFRAQESGIDPKEMKAEITALWQQSDSGRAFQAAVEEKGYLLAKGDRRDFILIDQEGDIHSLARWVDSAKAADIRAKMGDLDRDSLMDAKEASAWMKAKEGEAENSGSSDARILPQEQAQQVTGETLEPSHNPKLAVLEKYAHDHPALAPPETYPTAGSAQEFAELCRLVVDTSPVFDQRAWEVEEERLAALPDPPEATLDPSLGRWAQHIKDEREHQGEIEL